jgi:hypothetical protein
MSESAPEIVRCPDCGWRLKQYAGPRQDLAVFCERCLLDLTHEGVATVLERDPTLAHGPDCGRCGEPKIWSARDEKWVCADSPAAHAPPEGETCVYCGTEDVHQDGCPNGPIAKILCAACGEMVAVAEMAAHMNDEHGADLDQDAIEQQFLQVREFVKRAIGGGDDSFDGDNGPVLVSPMHIMEVWAAIGHRAVSGEWPDDFDMGSAIVASMRAFNDAAKSNNAAVDEIHRLNGLLETTEQEDENEIRFLRRVKNEIVDLITEADRATDEGLEHPDHFNQILRDGFLRLKMLLEPPTTEKPSSE